MEQVVRSTHSTETSAVKLLLKQRKAVADAIAQTPEGQELARLDAALLALGVNPSDMPARRTRQTASSSVRSKVRQLLDQQALKWTHEEIIEEYERRGESIGGKDPKAALRTALWALQKDNEVVRLDDGSFMSAKYWPPNVAEHA